MELDIMGRYLLDGAGFPQYTWKLHQPRQMEWRAVQAVEKVSVYQKARGSEPGTRPPTNSCGYRINPASDNWNSHRMKMEACGKGGGNDLTWQGECRKQKAWGARKDFSGNWFKANGEWIRRNFIF